MLSSSAMASGGDSHDASTWEDVLSAFSEELWAWSVVADRTASSDARKVKRARELARDLQVASGLFGVVSWERAQLLVDDAHELLESGVESVSGLKDLQPEEPGGETRPLARWPVREIASLVPDDADADEPTLPGVPAEVFRRYLASLST